MVKELKVDETLESVLTDEDTLVDFYASWCGPCKMLMPVLDTITEIKVIKVNVDEHPQLASEHGVMSIPTLIAFKNKEVYRKDMGYKTKEQILDMFS